MPKKTHIKSILVIGAGPIIIGQGCEFDYSGTQACKILKQEGYRVILINSNPATIMTDPDTADVIYIEPINFNFITKIIEKEKPDAILPTMGGQVALNCALELAEKGILAKYNIELLGASIATIHNAEDRKKFKEILQTLNLATPRCEFIHTLQEAKAIIKEFSFPVIIRPSFTLGGSGGGIAHNIDEYLALCQSGLRLSPITQIMLDESLLGWKEYELEVMRDKNNNCIVVCTIENLDPMGIHTGDSITVAPAMTLTDKEYQIMRQAAFAILAAVGLETGGANVQFAINPQTGRMVVIEMNPRVSRSSALASKATGYPIAKIAAQLAIGYTLPELTNEITGQFPASFEPTLDYTVVKIPRFNFEKFPETSPLLSTQMKSIGEVMAIGSTFQEALHKAIHSLEINKFCGITLKASCDKTSLKNKLISYHPERLWYIAEAFRQEFSIEEVHQLTTVDPWFLQEIQSLVYFEAQLKAFTLTTLNAENLQQAKQKGFSDQQIALHLSCKEQDIYAKRFDYNIFPTYKKIDTCAAEFSAPSGYFYSCYETECEAEPSSNKKIIVLGSGPNRIGQGIEFDYSCVHAIHAIKASGYEAIMINCNPETVSTDYDIADKLYFEPLTSEHVLNIIFLEKPDGVIVQTGGQTALNLIPHLKKFNVPILGTTLPNITLAENRSSFRDLINEIGLKQPANITLQYGDEFHDIKSLNFPVIIRPSNIIGGQAMKIIYSHQEYQNYFSIYAQEKSVFPLLVEEFLEDAIEVDADAIADGDASIVCGLLEHIEPAGIHSGDSACQYPPSFSANLKAQLTTQIKLLAKKLNIVGFLNVQFAIKNQQIYIIEANPRASRTIPFLAKATGIAWAKLATQCMLGKKLSALSPEPTTNNLFHVKEAVLPFNKFPEANLKLTPQMKSTGEVMASHICPNVAFLYAQFAAGFKINYQPGHTILLLNYYSHPEKLAEIAAACIDLKLKIVTDLKTKAVLDLQNTSCEIIDHPQIDKHIQNKSLACTLFLPQEIPNIFFNSLLKKVNQERLYYASTFQAALRCLNGLRMEKNYAL